MFFLVFSSHLLAYRHYVIKIVVGAGVEVRIKVVVRVGFRVVVRVEVGVRVGVRNNHIIYSRFLTCRYALSEGYSQNNH